MPRKLTDWLKAYMQYSSYSEAPDEFHFWTGISVIAGALRRRVWMDQGYFQWTPNFYIVFVAPPGVVKKSTTANIGMSMLRDTPGILFGPDSVTWQKLASSLAEAGREVPGPDGKLYPMSCLTIVSSEFGTFLNPNDREMIDVLVDLWDGKQGVWEKATKTQGNEKIINPWLNIIACTTPDWIAGNFPEYLIGGGFTSRCIFVYSEKKRQLVPYPKKKIPKEFVELRKDLLHDLELISQNVFGEYILEPEAIDYGVSWYTEHHNTLHTHLAGERFGGYLARKQTHVHKLAMVLAASKSDKLVITKDDLATAIEVMKIVEQTMPRVFDKIGKTEDSRRAGELVNIINSYDFMTRDQLYSMVFRSMSWKEFMDALESVIHSGLVKEMINSGKPGYTISR